MIIMRNIFEELETLLDKYCIDINEETYRRYLFEDDKELDLEEEIFNLLKDFSQISDFNIKHVGGFSSPGYDLDCAILIMVIDGKITSYNLNFEIC